MVLRRIFILLGMVICTSTTLVKANTAPENSTHPIINKEKGMFGIPSVVVSTITADPSNSTSLQFSVVFSEDVTGFDDNVNDVTIGGTAGATTALIAAIDAQNYTVSISGMTNSGTVTLDIPAAIATSTADGMDNTASTSTDNEITFGAAPDVVVSENSTDPTATSPIVFNVVFSEGVTGFTDNVNDVTIGGTAGATTAVIAAVDAQNYTVSISGMTNSGTVTLDIPAGAAQAIGGTNEDNTISTSTDNEITFGTAPGVVVSENSTDPTATSPIVFNVVFSEDVTGFTDNVNDVTIGGTAGATTAAIAAIDAQNYTVSISGMTNSGTVTLDIPAGAAQATLGTNEDNSLSTSTDNEITFGAAPGVVVSENSADPTATSPIVFDVVFSENVTGFTDNVNDVTIGGTAGATTAVIAAIDAQNYTVSISGMTNSGTVTLDIPAGAATATGGTMASNTNSTSTDNEISYGAVPGVVVSENSSDPTATSPIVFNVVFSEDVTGFTDNVNDVTIGGTAGATTAVIAAIDAQNYTVSISGMTNSGTVTLDIPAGAAQASLGTNEDNSISTSTDNEITYGAAPSVTVNQLTADPTTSGSIQFTVVFSEDVTGFTDNVNDVTIGGTAGATTAVITATDAQNYTVTLTGMTQTGTVTLDIPANAANASAGTNQGNAGSTAIDNSVTYHTNPTVAITPVADPTSSLPVAFDVVFSEPITGFTDDTNILLSGGINDLGTTVTVNEVAPNDGTTFQVSINNLTGGGTLTMVFAAGTGLADNTNALPSLIGNGPDNTISFVSSTPEVTINQVVGQVDPLNSIGTYSLQYDVVFSQDVTGFNDNVNDVIITYSGGGTTPTASISQTDAQNYVLTITEPDAGTEGDITVTIPANAANAITGSLDGNNASTSTDNVVRYDDVDPELIATNPLFPAHNSTGISTATKLLTATFTENMQLDVSTGTSNDVTLRIFEGNTEIYRLEKSNNALSVAGNTLTIDLDATDLGYTLKGNTLYKIAIGNDFIEDVTGTNGLNFAGFSENNWSFTTSSATVTPSIVSTCDNGRYVTLPDIVITEGSNNDFNTSGTVEVGFNGGGFALENGIGTIDVNPSPAGGSNNDIDAISITVGFSGFTINYTLDGGNNRTESIVISGLRVTADGSQATANLEITGGTADFNVTTGALATVNLGTAPAIPTVNYSSSTICEGDVLTPPATTAGPYNAITWYSDVNLTTVLSNSETPSNTDLGIDPSTNGVYTVYVTETNGCESDAQMVTVTVNPGTSADLLITSGSTTICNNYYKDKDNNASYTQESVTFEAFPSGATNYRFFDGTGDLQNGTSATFTSNTLTSGNVQVEVTKDGCLATSSAIAITLVTAPNTVDLTFPGGITSYPDNGDGVTLTGTPSPGSYTGSGVFGNVFYPAVATQGDHIIKYSANSGGCTSTIEKQVTVYDNVGAIAGLGTQLCVSDADVVISNLSVTILAIGLVYEGGDALADPSAVSGITFSPSKAGAGTFELRALYSNGDSRVQTVTVNPLPSAPITTSGNQDPQFCTGEDFSNTFISIVGTGVSWYSVPTPGGARTIITGIPDLENPSLTNLGLANNLPGTFYFEVTQTIGFCEGPALNISVKVNTTPGTIGTSVIPDYCSGETLNVIQLNSGDLVTGATTNFYSALLPNGKPDGTPLKSKLNGLEYDPELELEIDNDVNSDTNYERFVTQSIGGCEGTPTQVDLLVKAVPNAPIANSPTPYCQNETIANLVVLTGNNIKWYSDFELLNQVTPIADPKDVTAAELSIDNSVSDDYNNYVTQTVNGCESVATEVTVTVVDLPNPTFTGLDEGDAICKTGSILVLDGDDDGNSATADLGTWSGTAVSALFDIETTTGIAKLNPASVNLIPGNSYTLRYTAVAANSCSNFIEKNFTMNSEIIPDFNFNNGCEDDLVNILDASTISPTVPGLEVTTLEWDFEDVALPTSGAPTDAIIAERTTGTYEDLFHQFNGAGTFSIKLTASTSEGCSAAITKNINIGVIPDIEFSWKNVREDNQVEVTAVVNNLGDADINDYFWTFGSDAPVSASKIESYDFPLGQHTVDLRVVSKQLCDSTISKTVFVVPRISDIDASNAYFQDFNGEDADWVIGGTNPSWEHGKPTGTYISEDASNDGSGDIWVTNLSGNYNTNEQSWIHGPSFDLRNVDRPFIRFDIYSLTLEGLDGAVIQINTTNETENDANWQALGTVGGGIDWYNKTGIVAKPGNQASQDIGWSGNSDTGWHTAAYVLDDYKFENVRFRIAFASTGVAAPIDQPAEGFAIDNMFIGSRNRRVLFENFTNTSTTDVLNNDIFYKDYKSDPVTGLLGDDSEIVKLEYHTGFPGEDPLHDVNRADPSARATFYGTSTVSKAFIDGISQEGEYTTWVDNYFTQASLIPSLFSITIDTEEGEEEKLNLKATVELASDFDTESVQVYIAIVEKTIGLTGMENGQTEFNYVVKKLLPDAAGTYWEGPFVKGQTIEIEESFDMGGIYDPTETAIVVFIQDADTKTVHQSALLNNPSEVPGADEITSISGRERGIQIYPNPAKEYLTIDNTNYISSIESGRILDLNGKVVQTIQANSYDRKIEVNTSGLKNGIYLLQLVLGNGEVVFEKIEVLKR